MTDLSSNRSPTSILTKAEYMKIAKEKHNNTSKIDDKNQTDSIRTYESQVLINHKSHQENNIYTNNYQTNNKIYKKTHNVQYSTMTDDTFNSQILGLLTQQQIKIGQALTIDDKRDLVVNWIALIHTKYWFEQQTFHLAVNLIDQYIRKTTDLNEDYQLLAITCFWIASKVEERKIKELKIWMKLGRGFSRDEILQMQSRILLVLEYQLTQPTSQVLLWELIQNCTNLLDKQIHLCLYILQLSMLDSSFKKFEGGIIALSSIYLCLKIQGIQQSNIHNIFLLHWNEVRKCSRKLCKLLQKHQGNIKSPIVRKYSSRKLNRVAQIVFGRKSDSMSMMLTSQTSQMSKC